MSDTSMTVAEFDQLRALLESATTLRGRLVISGVVVLVSLAVGAVVTPYLTRRVRSVLRERVVTDDVGRWLDRAGDDVPLGLNVVHVVRVLQFGLVVVMGVALLVVWGLVGVARTTVSVLGGSVPWVARGGLTLVLVVVAYVATGLLDEFIERLTGESNQLDQHQAEIAFRVLQVGVIAVVGLVGLVVWDVELGGFLVGAGFLGIVIGMAARQTLGSLLAGFVLMFSRPFEVGDWIKVDGEEGIVTDITIVNTRLENFDGEYVVIPNDSIGNSTVVNRTRKGRLRVRLDVGVDYSVDPEVAEEVAMEAMSDVEEVMPVPRPEVVPKAFADSSIVLELRFWIDNPSSRRRWRAKAGVVRAVYSAFEESGIKIPYPQRELSGRQETGGLRIAEEHQDLRREPGAEAPTEEE